MAVLSMISIGEGAKQEMVQQIEQLGTRNIYLKAGNLTPDQRQKARERLSNGLTHQGCKQILIGCRDVRFVASLKEIAATVTDTPGGDFPADCRCYSQLWRYPELLFYPEADLSVTLDVRQKNMVCVLGDDVYESLGVQGKSGHYVRIENHLFRVVGILNRFHRKESKAGTIAVRNYNEMIFIPSGYRITAWPGGH